MANERLIQEALTRQGFKAVMMCEEASPRSRDTFIPCGSVASRFVLSERGRTVYAMCAGCANHNVKNRRAEDVGPTNGGR